MWDEVTTYVHARPLQCGTEPGLRGMYVEGRLGKVRVPYCELRDSKFEPSLPVIIKYV